MQTVKRGAGRPAAAARKAKHDQRDPQPRSHTTALLESEAAKAAQLNSDQKDTTPYGRMTVPELRARLAALGGKAPARATKGDIMNAILEAERAASTTDEPAEDTSAPAVVAATASAPAVGEGTDPKGRAKAAKLQDALYPHKWNFTSLTGEGTRVQLVMTRGSEVMTVVWDGGVFNYSETGHLVGERHTKVRNVSAAVKLGARPPEAAEADLGRVVANKRFKPSAPRGVPAQRKKALAGVDLATVTERELFALLGGQTIEWVNRVSNSTEVATVSGNDKFFRIDERSDGRVVQFAAGEMVKGKLVATGFRAARLDQIVRVGGSSRRRAQPEAVAA